jgi:uncharacterized membrane protein
MKYLSSFPHPGLHPLARLRAWHRTLAACAAGGLRFPGSDNPSYADFANYAVIIGMTSQVSDVHVETTAMRRLALAHGLVSFAFNLMVLVLAINVVAGALA